MTRWVKAVMAAMVTCTVFSAVLIVIALAQRKQTLDQTNHEVCVAVQNLNRAITASLHRSLMNLPRITYYRQHPAELASQQVEIHHQLAVFSPRECP